MGTRFVVYVSKQPKAAQFVVTQNLKRFEISRQNVKYHFFLQYVGIKEKVASGKALLGISQNTLRAKMVAFLSS